MDEAKNGDDRRETILPDPHHSNRSKNASPDLQDSEVGIMRSSNSGFVHSETIPLDVVTRLERVYELSEGPKLEAIFGKLNRTHVGKRLSKNSDWTPENNDLMGDNVQTLSIH